MTELEATLMQTEIDLNRAKLEELRATVDKMHADTEKALAETRKTNREWKLGPYVLAAGMLTAVGGLTAALTAIIHTLR